ncbi:MAG: diguanylate cyclase [Christensenellaceae bacterium]|jgi:diguanylate cyclase (GGDEF)-like protein
MDDQELRSLIQKANAALDNLLNGKIKKAYLDDDTSDPDVKSLIEKYNRAVSNLGEACTFAAELAEGELSGEVPSRKNMIASPLKQLHSQLNILMWNMRTLTSGKIVSKLDGTGELHDAFNSLVDKVAEDSTGTSLALKENDEETMNSWRYHQILRAINSLHIMIIELDSDCNIVYTNVPAREVLNDIDCLHPDRITEKMDPLIKDLSTFSAEGHPFPVLRELHDSKKDVWYKITTDTFTLPNGKRFFLHMVDDITDIKVRQKKLEMTAATDPLTGVYNRRSGMENLVNLLNNSPGSGPHCLAFVDIDGLKYINDTFGHTEGDFAIKKISDTILSSIRASYIVARYGGDEFFIIFKNCAIDIPNTIFKRIAKKLDDFNLQNLKPYPVSVSYGILPFVYDPARNPKDLLGEVDEIMYRNKLDKKTRQVPYPQKS